MRRALSGIAVVALAGAALVAVVAGPASAGFTTRLTITMSPPVGSVPPGTTFTVHGSCSGGNTADPTFDSSGTLTSGLGSNVVSGAPPATCTATETVTGGAPGVAYSCNRTFGSGSCTDSQHFTNGTTNTGFATINVTNFFLGPITLAPTTTTAGQTVTVSGGGCTAALSGGNANTGKPVQVTVGFPTPLTFTAQSANNPPGPAGSWSSPFTVPAGTPSGTYPVRALCLDPVAYPTLSLNVIATAAPRFTG